MYALPIGPGNSTAAYDLHNDYATDCTVFDHCHFTVTIDPNAPVRLLSFRLPETSRLQRQRISTPIPTPL